MYLFIYLLYFDWPLILLICRAQSSVICNNEYFMDAAEYKIQHLFESYLRPHAFLRIKFYKCF